MGLESVVVAADAGCIDEVLPAEVAITSGTLASATTGMMAWVTGVESAPISTGNVFLLDQALGAGHAGSPGVRALSE